MSQVWVQTKKILLVPLAALFCTPFSKWWHHLSLRWLVEYIYHSNYCSTKNFGRPQSAYCSMAMYVPGLESLYCYAPISVGWGHYKMMGGVCLSVCLSVRPSVCCVPRPNSRTERPRKPKIGRMEAHHKGNPRTYLDVKRSKVKVTRPINAPQRRGVNGS